MRYEIWFVETNGDEFYTGDYFFSYDEAINNINRLNENADEDSRVYIVKKCKFNRKGA